MPAPMRILVCTSIVVAAAANLAPVRPLRGQSSATELHHEFIPSRLAPSKRVEFYWVAPRGSGPWPAVVLIHGH